MRDGVVTLPSPLGAAETYGRLVSAVRGRGLVVFATIDHAQAAQSAGLEMNPASLVIFGSPRTGAPLMRRAPTLAIDLPLKALVWEDEEGATWLSYNDPAWLAQRHGLRDCDSPIMVWKQEGGASDARPGDVALLLRSMAHALSDIAGEATRPIAP